MFETLEIKVGRVTYWDIAEHNDVQKHEFFSDEGGLKRFSIFGYVMVGPHTTKVLYVDDETDDTEGDGYVIPNSCVIEIAYWPEAKPDTKDTN